MIGVTVVAESAGGNTEQPRGEVASLLLLVGQRGPGEHVLQKVEIPLGEGFGEALVGQRMTDRLQSASQGPTEPDASVHRASAS